MAALFTFPQFPSLSFSSNTLRFSPSHRHFSLLVRAQIAPSEGAKENKRGLAVLWFKHDLRIDDHPGLVAASNHPAVVPLYIFDHRLLCRKFLSLFLTTLKRDPEIGRVTIFQHTYAGFSEEKLEMVLLALEDLRNSLRSQGSNLMVRLGNAEYVLQKLVREVVTLSTLLTLYNFNYKLS